MKSELPHPSIGQREQQRILEPLESAFGHNMHWAHEVTERLHQFFLKWCEFYICAMAIALALISFLPEATQPKAYAVFVICLALINPPLINISIYLFAYGLALWQRVSSAGR